MADQPDRTGLREAAFRSAGWKPKHTAARIRTGFQETVSPGYIAPPGLSDQEVVRRSRQSARDRRRHVRKSNN